MESRINYTLVGLFVVLLFAGLIIFAFWLGKYGGQQQADYYHVYMKESVAGLSTDSSVKYRGVDVGVVETIGLNPDNSEQVFLLLRVDQNTPVKVDTVATLKSFGLTGLVYVELEGGSKDAPLLTASGNSSIAEIPARTSTFERFSESLTQLTDKTVLALDKFDRLLSDENLNHVNSILIETKALAEEFNAQLRGLTGLIDGGKRMGQSASQAFDQIKLVSARVKKMAEGVEKSSAQLSSSIRVDVHKSLESFNQVLYELNILAGDLQRTTEVIEASPADLLFKRSTPKPGPGEQGYNEK
ncbi:MlaD family protein [Neptunomonas qingdaonensis]|uniref:Phospholipid/cholesterol/gamma-HCH transport system substrate-binding protein n=1 Tax=Neptunomonas qingdaonensis TaxID=1045558 RepID=A0A1I2P355_9GAMM|nr:MlaD family protein [Neptunomonas qingdaonensis]SFG10635.1 phospholipid/cholesterol/gamma-HCH transport system substrate-binding protein [Neptunomonas qingdaonensis]